MGAELRFAVEPPPAAPAQILPLQPEIEAAGANIILFYYKIKAYIWPSWEIDGETVETVSDFIFLGSKITADGDCSHEIKRRLLLGFCGWLLLLLSRFSRVRLCATP